MHVQKPAKPTSNKSTNVRASVALGLTRALVSFGSRVAPFETGGFLVDAFTKTHRSVQRSVDLGDVLVFADRFELEHDGRRVRGFTMRPEGGHPNQVGEGPKVLLVHGWDGGAHQMLPFVRPLVERGFEVSLFDLPGHGASDGDHTTLREIADVVRAIDERHGPFEAVVAHSVGSAGTILAMLEGMQVDRAVFVAPPLSLEGQARAFAAMVGAEASSVRPMLATIRGILGRPIDAESWLADVESLRTKALFVHDREDKVTSFAGSERLVAHWPDAELIPTEGLGHARILRDASVLDAIVRFVDARECDRVVAAE